MVVYKQVPLFGQNTDYFLKMNDLTLLRMLYADEHIIDADLHGAFFLGTRLVVCRCKLRIFTENCQEVELHIVNVVVFALQYSLAYLCSQLSHYNFLAFHGSFIHLQRYVIQKGCLQMFLLVHQHAAQTRFVKIASLVEIFFVRYLIQHVFCVFYHE